MSITPDTWIEAAARERGMIEPFSDSLVRAGGASYGLGSYGYDVRLADEFHVLRSEDPGAVLDPREPRPELFEVARGPSCLVPPHGFVLGRTVEYLRIPREVLVLASGKSTWARLGILVNVTPFEPEWEGHVTLGISNTTPLPVRLHAGEGIAQIMFVVASSPCRVSYRDRKGKYQAQTATTHARV